MDFYWGLPLGRLAGIEITVHWSLFLFWLYELDPILRADESVRGRVFLGWAVGRGLMFLSILLHEFGHCFAARRVGGDADRILMWPLGGLAFCHCPDFWKSHLIVAAGGPLVTLAIVAVSYPTFFFLDHQFPELKYETLVHWNFLILLFNLVPLYPLDGGRIFHALTWGYFSRQGGYVWGGHSRASLVTLQVSRVTAVLGIAYGVLNRDMFIVIICLWALSGAERLKEDTGFL